MCREQDMVLVAAYGIKDPLRKEVPDAVLKCQRAGITVRMLTGDSLLTAKNIAKEAQILTPGGIVMEGPDFSKLSPQAQKDVLQSVRPDGRVQKLQVLARCSPQDKFTIVQRLKELGEVVAVTGDGTNDAPALKEADVGLSMGVAGTAVAQEASDIVIMDDNFSSIVKSVMWGRSVYDNIRRFLQFQLTVNVVALVICMVGAVTGFGTPLKPVQLLVSVCVGVGVGVCVCTHSCARQGCVRVRRAGHACPFFQGTHVRVCVYVHVYLCVCVCICVCVQWVNLIMDTFGALALATEDPTPDLLHRQPYGRFDR